MIQQGHSSLYTLTAPNLYDYLREAGTGHLAVCLMEEE